MIWDIWTDYITPFNIEIDIPTEGKILEWTITGEAFEVCIRPKETLTFAWEGPFHNVEKVDAEGWVKTTFVPIDIALVDMWICRYENCNGFDNTDGVEGPYIFSNRNEGTYYFVCGVSCFFENIFIIILPFLENFYPMTGLSQTTSTMTFLAILQLVRCFLWTRHFQT